MGTTNSFKRILHLLHSRMLLSAREIFAERALNRTSGLQGKNKTPTVGTAVFD
jgi:hypothetical protein